MLNNTDLFHQMQKKLSTSDPASFLCIGQTSLLIVQIFIFGLIQLPLNFENKLVKVSKADIAL